MSVLLACLLAVLHHQQSERDKARLGEEDGKGNKDKGEEWGRIKVSGLPTLDGEIMVVI